MFNFLGRDFFNALSEKNEAEFSVQLIRQARACALGPSRPGGGDMSSAMRVPHRACTFDGRAAPHPDISQGAASPRASMDVGRAGQQLHACPAMHPLIPGCCVLLHNCKCRGAAAGTWAALPSASQSLCSRATSRQAKSHHARPRSALPAQLLRRRTCADQHDEADVLLVACHQAQPAHVHTDRASPAWPLASRQDLPLSARMCIRSEGVARPQCAPDHLHMISAMS